MTVPETNDPLLMDAAREMLSILDECGDVQAETFHGLTMLGLNRDEAERYLLAIGNTWHRETKSAKPWLRDGDVC